MAAWTEGTLRTSERVHATGDRQADALCLLRACCVRACVRAATPQVHKVVSTGGLAVIGIMMEGGAAIPNPAVQTAYLFAPPGAREQMAVSGGSGRKGRRARRLSTHSPRRRAVRTRWRFSRARAQATRPLDPLTLLPADNGKGHRPYVHYAGSLTTPPCSEGVDWFVMTQPIRVTDRQVRQEGARHVHTVDVGAWCLVAPPKANLTPVAAAAAAAVRADPGLHEVRGRRPHVRAELAPHPARGRAPVQVRALERGRRRRKARLFWSCE